MFVQVCDMGGGARFPARQPWHWPPVDKSQKIWPGNCTKNGERKPPIPAG